MATRKKSGLKRAAPKKRARKATAGSRGVLPADCFVADSEFESQTKARISAEGGQVLAAYCDPLGKTPIVFAVLPIGSVEPTPYQRDVSDMHHKRLADVIDKTGLFLDPIIAILAPGKGFWTPNGGHRLAAMKRLGARAITALVIPKKEVAWQILALNTEKAHNLKEKATEVIRIFRHLMEEDPKLTEQACAFYLEEASLATLGICYEQNARFSGGAYNPVVKRLSTFSDLNLSAALKTRQKHAELVMELDSKVGEAVAKLKAKGFVSPYLKAFVVGRINPLRWIQGEPPPLEEVLKTMRDRAAKFNTDKVKQEDLAGSGGAPDDSE